MSELVWSGIVVADEPVERVVPRREDVVERPVPGPTLAVDDLSIAYRIRSNEHQVVSQVSLSVAPGETLAILGESGSGKSTIVKAVVGTLAPNARTLGGSIRVDGTELGSLNERQRRRLRGPRIGYVPQNPGGSLDPLIRVGDQVAEMFHTHGVTAGLAGGRGRDLPGPRHRSRRRKLAVSQPLLEALARAGFDEPEKIVRQYPHELSGGMQQRVLIAMALALEPGLLLADEPTSALDVTVQKTVLDLLDEMSALLDLATVIVTHDIGVARDRSDTVLVLAGGHVVEHGPTAQVLTDPAHDYTRQLLRDVPTMIARRRTPVGEVAGTNPGRMAPPTPVVEVEGLVVDYRSATGRGTFRAVDDVSFRVDRGTTLAIVGESGSGKSTTVRTVARFVRPAVGLIRISDRDGRDLTGASDRELRRVVQLVYQNPHASLDPRQRIGSILREPMKALCVVDRDAGSARVAELLGLVGLPATMAARRPRELSGGQLQRAAIARALAVEPEILILDEPVSALDVTVQAQILELLASLQRELDLTYLFISHDLGVVRQVADRILVLKEGRTVEQGQSEDVFTRTRSAYTRALLDAVPGRSSGFIDLTDPIPSTGAPA